MCQISKQTLGKEKTSKRKRKETPQRVFCKKGLMYKKQTKNGFLKGSTKAKKQNRKKRNTLRQAFGGNKIDKKPLKLQENSLFGPFYKTHDKNTGNEKQNHQKAKNKKTYQKKTFLHFGKQPHVFGKVLFLFKLHSFMSTKLCFAENTIKIVFSAEHSF